jgi:mono/diheme cytochrome c family protein
MAGAAKVLLLLLFGAVGLLSAAATPGRAGNAEVGRLLARRWCATCHMVEVAGPGAHSTEAPPFPVLANNARWTRERLKAFLMAPHPPMPPVNLSTFDIDDLVAHIASLKQPLNGSAEAHRPKVKGGKHHRKYHPSPFRFAADGGGCTIISPGTTPKCRVDLPPPPTLPNWGHD